MKHAKEGAMGAYQIRVLAVFGIGLAFVLSLGGGLLAGAIITEQYALAAPIVAALGLILVGLGYAFVVAMRRCEREARVRRRLEATLTNK
jgi:hypothetical protein